MHSISTETFVAGGSNGVLQTNPTVLHFSGYRVGHLHKQTLVSFSSQFLCSLHLALVVSRKPTTDGGAG